METKKRLGELLLEAGVIDQTQLQAALGHQRRWGMKLGQALLDLKLVTEPQVVAALSRKFGYEVVHLDAVQPGPMLAAAMKLVPRDVAAKHTLLPVAADASSITVAMADPTNIAVVDELSFRTGRRVKVSIAGERELAAAIRKHYFGEEVRSGPEPIAFDETDIPMEASGEPFATLPDHLQEGYVDRPSGTGPAAAGPTGYRAPKTPPPVLRPPAEGASAEPAARPWPAPSSITEPLLQPAAPGPPAPDEVVVEMSELVTTPVPGALSPREAALTDAIDRLAGASQNPGGAAVKVAASMVRLLIKKGYFSEVDFLDELQRH
jgi:hypothetical protein